MTEIFKNLSKNPEFKKKFVTKNIIHLATTFSSEHINAVFDSIVPIVEAEYCAGNKKDANTDTQRMRNFALNRGKNVLSHLQKYIIADSIVHLTINSNVPGATFTINGEKVTEGFDGDYLAGFDTELKAYPPVGYTFSGWNLSVPSMFNVEAVYQPSVCNLPGKLVGQLVAEGIITAVFTPETDDATTLRINEICASSDKESGNADDYLQYPDWIEIHNYGTTDIDLAGMALSNNKNDLTKSVIPFGSEKTIVPAGGHLVLWAKGNAADGPLYLSFKMDVDKRKDIFLTNAQGDIVSQAYYDNHSVNASYGWQDDQTENWTVFENCRNLGYTASPGQANGSGCDATELVVNDAALAVNIAPNPTNGMATISCREVMDMVEIYSSNGRFLFSVEPNSANVTVDFSHLAKGIYIVKVLSKDNVFILKEIRN